MRLLRRRRVHANRDGAAASLKSVHERILTRGMLRVRIRISCARLLCRRRKQSVHEVGDETAASLRNACGLSIIRMFGAVPEGMEGL